MVIANANSTRSVGTAAAESQELSNVVPLPEANRADIQNSRGSDPVGWLREKVESIAAIAKQFIARNSGPTAPVAQSVAKEFRGLMNGAARQMIVTADNAPNLAPRYAATRIKEIGCDVSRFVSTVSTYLGESFSDGRSFPKELKNAFDAWATAVQEGSAMLQAAAALETETPDASSSIQKAYAALLNGADRLEREVSQGTGLSAPKVAASVDALARRYADMLHEIGRGYDPQSIFRQALDQQATRHTECATVVGDILCEIHTRIIAASKGGMGKAA